VRSAVSVEGGHPLDETARRCRRQPRRHPAARASDAPLKVLVETTTLDINAGQPAIDHVRAALQAG
jgi:hypothetical protein